ncbi:MAG: cell division protein FtsA [Clostridia bacterium]|nr:cell division protein FtsA [Clostridia bacterium]
MAIGDLIVGIDIGTSRVCCCLGQINKFNQVEILNSASCECDGFKKGKYESTDAIARAIRFAIGDIEKQYDFVIKSAYVNIIGKYVDTYSTKYSVELEDKYAGVSQENIDDIIKGAASSELPYDYQIIDIVPTKFVTDTKVTDDPIGIYTKTLSADLDILVAKKDIVKMISLAMQKAGLSIDGIVLNGFAIKDIVLEEKELQDGVLLLDVGDSNIDISIFKNKSVIYTDSLPAGGDTITNDIASALEISSDEAIKLKKQYGLSDRKYIEHDYSIKLSSYTGEDIRNSSVRCSELVEIMETRIKDVISVIENNLYNNRLSKEIRSCVISGIGFSGINKIEKTVEEILKVGVRFGNAKTANLIKPTCVTSYGIVKYISNIKYTKNIGSKIQEDEEQSILGSTMKNLKKAFSSAFKKNKK